MTHSPTTLVMARREAAWKEALRDAEDRARQRLDAICQHLGLDAASTGALVHGAMEVARQFSAESTYANYEHRTGTPWPEEWREFDEEERQAAWRIALERVEAVAKGIVRRV
jgi:hypothetical protein